MANPLKVVLIFVGFVVSRCVHIWIKGRSRFHIAWSLLIHFLLNRFIYLLGAKAKRKLEQDTKNFRQVQEKFLLNILKRNSQTKYGRKCNFTHIRNRRGFTVSHPITKYSHYKSLVGRYLFSVFRYLIIESNTSPLHQRVVINQTLIT